MRITGRYLVNRNEEKCDGKTNMRRIKTEVGNK